MATWAESFYLWKEDSQDFVRYDSVAMSMTRFVFDKNEKGKTIAWCGGGDYGLTAYDFESRKYFQFKNDPRNKYSHNLGQAIFLLKDSASGIVWIGTEKGLEKYDRFAIRFKRHHVWQNHDSLTNSQYFLLSAFIKDNTDPSGNTYWMGIWIGGIMKINRKNNTSISFNGSNGLKNDGIFSMIQARDGNIWVGHAGIQVLDPRTGKFIHTYDDFYPNPSGNKVVTKLMEDVNGNIWICSYQGLFEWERSSGKIINWSVRSKELTGSIGSIAGDKQGNVWITNSSGLFRIDPATQRFSYFTNKTRKGRKLPDDPLGSVMVDGDETIWVSGSGFLAHLDKAGEVRQLYTSKNGYQGISVFSMQEDAQHKIWLGTDNKLHRLDPATGQFVYFNKDDGLLSNQVADGFKLMEDGELFLGFNGGYCSIQTDKIDFNRNAPAIRISELLINGRPRLFDTDNKITVKPGERNILIKFAALNYSQSPKNRYAFRIDGLDTGWKYTSDRTISLMNLDGGLHHIHIKASNNDGVWSDEQVYTVKVIPPFRKTIWFTLLLAAMIGGIIYLISWYRKDQQKQLERIRNRIATDLHDDMGSTLSSIRIISDVAKKNLEAKNPETVPLLERISSNAASLSENMQDIVWTIRNDNDSLEDLVSRMREFGLRVCDAKHIRFNVEVSKNFKTSKLSLEQRRNLYLIFKETLNNAVKYAECTQIDLLLMQTGRNLKMDIADNGKGFEMTTVKRGNGLNNLEKRAGEIRGEITIHSKPGEGTRISLVVILRKTALREKKITK
jgi:two-component sensor histidine kinase/sugar lactone lactonase YvrE